VIIPEEAILRASKWCYSGVWSVITRWFFVPAEPPRLRGADDQQVRSFRPAQGFLHYLKFFFWIALVLFDGALFIGWVVLLATYTTWGIVLSPLIWAVIILPDIVAYIAIHLRYDTTWYVLSDRSMRIRRGIWVIHETTITYDNIQNVSIRQGPLQRYFGIADVLVETAGGGAATGDGEGATVLGHSGLLEGIDKAREVRDLILAKWKGSRSAGLGDESGGSISGAGFTPAHVDVLKEIRDLAVTLSR
jgi:membrane protein YdbS with pleckstrin-like domain